MDTFNWRRKGISRSEIVVTSTDGSVTATFLRKNSLFSHKTRVSWLDNQYIMNYDGSLRDNVIAYKDKEEIARYEADMFIEEGTLIMVSTKKSFSYRRKEHLKSYVFELLDGKDLIGSLEITTQTGTSSEGVLNLTEGWRNLDPVVPALFVQLAVHN